MPSAHSLADDLAQAGWVAADRALAEAWRDFARLDQVLAGARKGRGEVDLVRQNLMRAFRLRGFTMIGSVGESQKFDPEAHELVEGESPKSGARVTVVTPGAGRMIDGQLRVVAPALVRRSRPRAQQTPRSAGKMDGAAGRGRAPSRSRAAARHNGGNQQ